MTRSINEIKQYVRELPASLLISTVLLPVIGAAVVFQTGYQPLPENTRLFLSTLAGAQAAVLAIVFSITVIGIQLVSNRYSPRMISLFTNSPLFLYTFILFVLSIAVDLTLLYTVPATGTNIHTTGLGAAAGLGLTNALALLIFVKTAVIQSTPDGAIEAFTSRMTPEKYLRKVRDSTTNDSEEAHPLHPLYNLTMNALSNGEKLTAKKALHEYGNLSKNILADLSQDDVFENEENQVADHLFRPVLTEHLHDIALEAEEQEENKMVTTAVKLQHQLGKQALDDSNQMVARQAQFGLSDVILHSPVETGSLNSCNTAWRQLGDFLVEAAEKPEPRIVRIISSSIETEISRQIWKVEDIYWYHHAMHRLYGNIAKAQKHLLEHYGNEIECLDIDWQVDRIPDNLENRENTYSIYKWRKTLLDTTSTFLHYAANEGVYPITPANFKDSWKTICIDASQSPPENYAVTLCQALIEIAVIDRAIGEDGIPWSSTIGRVMDEGDKEIVEKAFDRILQYDYVDEEPGILAAGYMDQHHEKFYPRQISVRDQPTLNTRPDYPKVIVEIKRGSDQHWKKLQD